MNLRRIFSTVIPAFLLMAVSAFAADLKITDTSNNTLVVHDAVLDYGSFMADKEVAGIRLFQGDALITAKWTNLESVTVTGKDESVSPAKFKVEIMMKNGQKVSGFLLNKGRMKLTGRSDLGDYSIDILKIHAIVPLAP